MSPSSPSPSFRSHENHCPMNHTLSLTHNIVAQSDSFGAFLAFLQEPKSFSTPDYSSQQHCCDCW